MISEKELRTRLNSFAYLFIKKNKLMRHGMRVSDKIYVHPLYILFQAEPKENDNYTYFHRSELFSISDNQFHEPYEYWLERLCEALGFKTEDDFFVYLDELTIELV